MKFLEQTRMSMGGQKFAGVSSLSTYPYKPHDIAGKAMY